MIIEIIDKREHKKGIVYVIKTDNKQSNILFLCHAIDRMRRWNIQEEMVIKTLIQPEEVITGHRGRFIAHKRYGLHLLRAVYDYEEGLPVLITVYFPYIERYFKGGVSYEDKILERC
jgi:hypothetical protein